MIAAASALAGLGAGYLAFDGDESGPPTSTTIVPQIVGTVCQKGVSTPDGPVNILIIKWSDGTDTPIPQTVRSGC